MGFAGEITVSICFSVAAAICCYRFYLRLVVVRNYIWAEISLIFALCMQIGLLGSQLQAFKLDRQKDSVQAVRHSAQMFVVGAYFYLNALWSVKISVNLLHVRVTQKFPRLNAWAVRSVYIILFCWIVVLVSFHFGCIPFSRRWDGLVGKADPCPNVVREWDFWTHIILHISSDIAREYPSLFITFCSFFYLVSILPYAALVSIQEWRLRAAVYGVYGIAFISVIASIVRAVLLGINPRSNASTIRILSMIEVSTAIIVGALPCISSAFTRKFVNRSSDNIYFSGQVNDSTGYNDRANVQLKCSAHSERNTSFALSESTSGMVIGQTAPSSSGESTEDIIGLDEIREVTTITMGIS